MKAHHHHHLLENRENRSNVVMAVEIDGLYYTNDEGTYLPMDKWQYVRPLDVSPDLQAAQQIANGLGLEGATKE